MTHLLLLAGLLASAGAAPIPEDPVKVSIRVAPTPAIPGEEAAVTIVLEPKAGIKLNKYPKVRLQVGAAPGLTAATEGAIGATRPPPSDQLESNYFKGAVDPLVVKLAVDPAAASGKHEVPGRLSYYYCVAASGYCAPAKVDVSIPLTIR